MNDRNHTKRFVFLIFPRALQWWLYLSVVVKLVLEEPCCWERQLVNPTGRTKPAASKMLFTSYCNFYLYTGRIILSNT